MSNTLSGHLQELENKGKDWLGNPKRWSWSLMGVVAYESFSLQSLIKSLFKQGFTKVVVT